MSVIELCNKIQTIQKERIKWERRLEYIHYMSVSEQESLFETTQCLKNKIINSKEEEFRNLLTIQMNPSTINEIVVILNHQSEQIKILIEKVEELETKLHKLHS